MIKPDTKSKIFPLLVLALLVLVPQIRADYLWPLPASNELTSNFCAFRGGHYHAGLDIRTHGRPGYDVVAVEDGYLWRVSSNWWGYGNAAYLMLDDGNIAVYGHLQEFAPAVEKFVRRKQQEQGRFKVNLFPEKDQFRFRKGDLIGISGQSGSGAPHLHFEIRSPDNMPLDPFPFYPLLTDGRAPRFEEITFRPLDQDAYVDGYAYPLSKDLAYNKIENDYRLDYIPIISGNVGVEIKVTDYRNKVSRKYNVAGLRFYLNDELVFETRYDTLNFDSWNSVDLDYNHYQRIENKSFYHNLYYPDGKRSSRQNPDRNCLTCGDNPVNDKLAPGSYNARVVAIDFNGNQRTALFELYIAPRVKFGYRVSTLLGKPESGPANPLDSYYFSSDGRNALTANISLYDPDIGKFLPEKSLDLSAANSKNPGNIGLVKIYEIIDPNTEDYRLARINFLESGKEISSWLLGVGMNPDRHFLDSRLAGAVDFIDSVEFISSEPHARINLQKLYGFLMRNNFHANFAERIESGDKIAFPLKLQCPLPEYAYGEGFSILVNYLVVEKLFSSGYFLHLRGDTSSIAIKNLKLDFSPKLPADLLIRYETLNSPGDSFIEQISLIPDDRLLIEGMDMSFKLPPSYPAQKTAIFGISRKGDPSFLDNQYVDSGHVSATARSLGTYRLMVDTIPPSIRNLYPGNNSTVRTSKPKIRFHMDDELAGFNSDTLLTVTLDGEYMVSEYDVDNKIVYLHLLDGLEPGKHSLRILARDILGNTTIKESSFYYSARKK